MVATSKVLMTWSSTNVGYSYGSNHLVMTGQDSGEVNQIYTPVCTARTDAIQNYVESHMGMI